MSTNNHRNEGYAIVGPHDAEHSDFEQATGHFHDEIEELYLITTGTLTMRFGDDIHT